MKILDNLTVRVSWMLVLAVFSLLVLIVGALGHYANHYSRQAFGTLNQINVEQATALNRAYIDMLRARVEMDRAAELIRVPSFDAPGPVMERAETLMHSADAAFARFLAVPAQAEQAEAIEALSQRFQSLLNTGLALQLMVLEDGDHAGYRSGQSRVSDMSQAFMASADAFFRASQTSGAGLVSNFTRVGDWMNRAIAAAVALSLLMVGLVLWGVTLNVIRPLRRIVGHFERMAEGDLSAPIERRGRNEIGQLFIGLAMMQRNLASTVDRVRTQSRSIHAGIHEIARGNGDLSSRTEQQAASLEETASSMEELTSTVARNAENARQASQLAIAAARTARHGGDAVARVVKTMRDIDRGSRQVAEILGVIDDIAFQTNILALNASVEAARAGEQGRGFAVVAGEVRALAGRSATAASQVRELIIASSQQVETGSALVERAGETMTTSVAEIQRVTELMEDIAAASHEQSHGIAQVNQAVAQMDRVTQQNTHLVRQAASASQALEGAATTLRDGVARFRLAGDLELEEDRGDTTTASKPARLPHARRSQATMEDARPAYA